VSDTDDAPALVPRSIGGAPDALFGDGLLVAEATDEALSGVDGGVAVGSSREWDARSASIAALGKNPALPWGPADGSPKSAAKKGEEDVCISSVSRSVSESVFFSMKWSIV
jgi:hypothetical protein